MFVVVWLQPLRPQVAIQLVIYTMATNTQQPVSVADLDVQQLADVRRQLDEVRACPPCRSPSSQLIGTVGVDASHQLVHSTETGSGKIQVMHR
jgi:hypothetical protein